MPVIQWFCVHAGFVQSSRSHIIFIVACVTTAVYIGRNIGYHFDFFSCFMCMAVL